MKQQKNGVNEQVENKMITRQQAKNCNEEETMMLFNVDYMCAKHYITNHQNADLLQKEDIKANEEPKQLQMNKNEKFQWGDDDIIRGKMNKTMETKMKKCDEEF